MSYRFNAEEIFEMAEQIEKNGEAFYKAAAEGVSEQANKDFLLELAAMEVEHAVTFAKMKSELTAAEKEGTVFDPNGEAPLYLKALADTRVFFEKETDTSSMEAILKDAITAEKDSIVFYLGMKDLVEEEQGRKRIGAIIKEEMSHIRLLSNKLTSLKK
jgi:rubrerythrin